MTDRVVEVELTDQQRYLLGWLISRVGSALLEAHQAGASIDDPIRLARCFSNPRSSVPLAATLRRGAHGHGRRTTTVKLHADTVAWWLRAITFAVMEVDWPREIKIELARLIVPLTAGLAAKRGKRSRTPDADVAALASRVGPRRAAAQLGVDDETVRRAVRRDKRRREHVGPATRMLLSK